MVGSTGHGADTVVTGGETTSDSSAQASVAVSGVVDTLEEGKLGSVEGLVRSDGVAHVLDGDVSVANDIASISELLGRGVVGVVGVGEGAKVHVCDLHVNIEVLVRLRLLAGHRTCDDGRGHVVLSWDLTHGDTVARSSLVLEAIGQGLARAEVDEVVFIRDGGGLARFGTGFLSI